MMGKQVVVDIAVVLVTFGALIGVYYFFKGNDDALLSLVATPAAVQPGEGGGRGSKTETALVMLQSIKLDDSIFSDPAYLALKQYQVTIPTVPLGRQYPFTPPPILLERSRIGKTQTPSHLKTVVPLGVPSVSDKLNTIKQTVGN